MIIIASKTITIWAIKSLFHDNLVVNSSNMGVRVRAYILGFGTSRVKLKHCKRVHSGS